ncbi:biopolymer transporter ExbD [bacterium]|nr:biopolymer transporter ExbD [bacterium]
MATKRRDSFNEINITPLTDIFLVLLVIMMVIAPLMDEQGLNLTVPDNVVAEKIKDSKILNVVVTAEGLYYVNDMAVDASDLANVIKSNMDQYPDGLMIQADGDSSHGAVVKLMDEARSAGVKNISVTQI